MYLRFVTNVYESLKCVTTPEQMDEVISFWDLVSLAEKCRRSPKTIPEVTARVRLAHRLLTDTSIQIPRHLWDDGIADIQMETVDATSQSSSETSSSSSSETCPTATLGITVSPDAVDKSRTETAAIKRRYGRRILELENLRRKLLWKHKVWEQTKVSVHHEQKKASDEFAVTAKEVTDSISSSRTLGREIFKLTNSANVNCYGVLDLEQILPVPRKQFADTDLHNLKSGEALDIFRGRLNELRIVVNMLRETFFWFVVTGKGENSPNGVATIKREVLRILNEFQDKHNTPRSGIEFAEPSCNEGRIDVVFYYQSILPAKIGDAQP